MASLRRSFIIAYVFLTFVRESGRALSLVFRFRPPAHTHLPQRIYGLRGLTDPVTCVCVVCVHGTRVRLGVGLAGRRNPGGENSSQSRPFGRSFLPSGGETFSREKAREQQEGKDWRQALQWPSSCESQRMADGAQTDAIEPAWNSCCDACSCSDAVRQQGWQTLQELRRQKDIFTDGQVWLVWHSRQRGY